jgi:hypothetical protein
MIKLTWATEHIVLDKRTFDTSLSAHRFVRKQLGAMPQCHAKWQPTRVYVFNGTQLHSSFTITKE